MTTRFEAIRIEPYLRATGRAHPELAARFDELAHTTLTTKRALVHGDVSPKNILRGPAGPVFLDAECAWFGDPAFDLAFCLNHLLLKGAREGADRTHYNSAFSTLADAYLARVDWESADGLEARAAALLPALFLARVDGKSPVEYLTRESERATVRRCADAAGRRSAASCHRRRRRLGAPPMSVYPGANHCLILRSDAQHRVSKDGPESFARLAHAGAPIEAPSGRLRARGSGRLRARGELR